MKQRSGKPISYTRRPESEETKKKKSDAQKGKHHSDESKQKNRESHLGKTHSDESKQKMKESQIKRRQRERKHYPSLEKF